MDNITKDYWSERYKNLDIPWDVGKITTPIKAFIDRLTDPSLRILIPGGGNSYEAEYLLEKGFLSTYVLDISPQPLRNLKLRCPSFPDRQLLCEDFFEHRGEYDLILEQTFFCALAKSFRPAYVQKMKELIVPDGRLAGVLFDEPLNDDHPPYGGSREEYEACFSVAFEVLTLERCRNSIPERQGSELFFCLKRP